jgi:hypothetical protein
MAASKVERVAPRMNVVVAHGRPSSRSSRAKRDVSSGGQDVTGYELS